MKKVKFRIRERGDDYIYNDIWFSDFDGELFIPACCYLDRLIIEMLTGIDEKGNEIWEEIDNE